ncbi:hypothetical protein [Paenibacillus spongiae]|uniref:Uncharacterized protein n=1 Tax=Paenibacillus spongiae TaxID=2909671 RepID=A0ABY5S687_9BACL|nr:hypothetical protein [Paenibacillus spongiae]UVI29174.1 hypothetical protein L1F29_27685 [Paenibacillus spongiae]
MNQGFVDYVKRHEPSGGPVSGRLHDYTESAYPRTKQIAQTLEKAIAGPPSLTANGSFETARIRSRMVGRNGSPSRSKAPLRSMCIPVKPVLAFSLQAVGTWGNSRRI